ncbi:N-formylglutamate amidohydrolase [Pontibacter ruber]|uniref:N-formylglutamate amidohydrolase n=1 Tax=Pontibacter ruber TaxID=1343895 RepID=A0ABW5CTM0_9BACT|nr:N-formylglutamate amidohydrolase [Pontibacter ruber]
MLKLLITCEHGGNQVPPEYASLFDGQEEVLASHQGYDIGALDLFHTLKELADVSFYAETSRLLVELNRSQRHPKLFSAITKALPETEKKKILKVHYHPYRERVEHMIQDLVSAGRQVLHIAVHSFTPVLDGQERQADIGLLYDPKRSLEQNFCKTWKDKLLQQRDKLLVRFNYPYLGISDGFPTYLRRKFDAGSYAGIELEVNQKYPAGNNEGWQQLKHTLKESLREAVEKQ